MGGKQRPKHTAGWFVYTHILHRAVLLAGHFFVVVLFQWREVKMLEVTSVRMKRNF